MKLYRVRNWSKHFENNRTRELLSMAWVPVPNRHDGDGYTEILDHPNGLAHFGAWCLILQVASKCDPRGTLLRDSRTQLRDGAECSKPHDSASLSRVTRAPRKIFDEALPRLVSIGWLEEVQTIAGEEVASEECANISESMAYDEAEERAALDCDNPAPWSVDAAHVAADPKVKPAPRRAAVVRKSRRLRPNVFFVWFHKMASESECFSFCGSVRLILVRARQSGGWHRVWRDNFSSV